MRILLSIPVFALSCASAASAQGRTDALPLGALIDSAAVHAGLATLDAPPRGRFFALSYDDGGRPSVQPVDRSVPDGGDQAIQAVLERAARTLPPGAGPQAATLQLTAGPAPRIVRVATVEEPPRLRNRTAVSRDLTRAGEEVVAFLPALAGRRVNAEMSLIIAEDGSVADARILTSTGVSRADQELLRVAAGMRFRPARVDGRAVPVKVQLPISIVPALPGQHVPNDGPPAAGRSPFPPPARVP